MVYIISAAVFVIGFVAAAVGLSKDKEGLVTGGVIITILALFVASMTYLSLTVSNHKDNRINYCKQAVIDNRFNSQEECLYILENY